LITIKITFSRTANNTLTTADCTALVGKWQCQSNWTPISTGTS